MRLRALLVLMALGVAACGGSATTSTIGNTVEASELDLAGLTLDVHQAPD